MNKEKINQFESQCWEERKYGPHWFDYMKFAELVWNEAYRKGVDDGWTDDYWRERMRLRRFWCWFFVGHNWDKTDSNKMMSREMNRCTICGAYEPGSD